MERTYTQAQLSELQSKLKVLGVIKEEDFTAAYVESLSDFLEGFHFMRLGQAIHRGQWDSAIMTMRRMEQTAKCLGMQCLEQNFKGLKQAVMYKNQTQAKQIMVMVTQKRVRIRNEIYKATVL